LRAFLLLGVLALPAWGQNALERGRAARKAFAKNPIPIPKEERDCFVPERMSGASCAAGFQLCFEGIAQASCDGYGRETLTLRPEYEGEHAPNGFGVNGARPGMPLRFEAGYEPDFVASMACDMVSLGYGVLTTPGQTPEQRERAEKRAREEAEKLQAIEHEKCMTREKAKVDKDRLWQRCVLLSVDACRREAFLECKGNTQQRGLVRASWSQPKDKPASETLKIEVLER
jgi:hypothetical protein